MSDPQFKCQYQSHKEESVIAVCVNIACNQPRLCCFLCMQEAYHDQHRKEILKIQQLNNWKQDGVKIIDAIKMIISEQENMISLLKQLVLENQNAIDVNIEYATATKIEDAINQINKLRKIDSILQTDLDQLSGQIKKKLKELKSQIGQQMAEKPNKSKILITEITILKQRTISSPMIKFKFSELDKHQQIEVSDKGQVAKGGLLSGFCFCEPALQRKNETTFAIKYISGGVWIGICKGDVIKKFKYRSCLNNIGNGSYLMSYNGYSYSHHQKEMNNKQQSLMFFQNDIIIVKVDLSLLKITWD